MPEAEAIARQMRGDGAERYQLSAARWSPPQAVAVRPSGFREASRAPSSSNLIALARVQMATGQAAAALARIETWLEDAPRRFRWCFAPRAKLRGEGQAEYARGYFERPVKA